MQEGQRTVRLRLHIARVLRYHVLMCARYVIYSKGTRILKAFRAVGPASGLRPSYNVAPTQSVPIVIRPDEANRLVMARWGLIPRWAKDMKIGNKMINARAETLHEKPSFRNLLKTHRCLVVADGFYEWKHEGGRKLPLFITLKDRHPFGMAGLYSEWKDPEGRMVTTCTIATTAANRLLGEVHKRMPVILAPGDEEEWLRPEALSPKELMGILRAYPEDEMDMYPVSPEVNRPSNDSPENIKRVS